LESYSINVAGYLPEYMTVCSGQINCVALCLLILDLERDMIDIKALMQQCIDRCAQV